MPLPDPSKDTIAIVTGASSGIGADLARGLARRGHNVGLVARRRDRLQELADELSGDVRAEVLEADLEDAGSRDRLVNALATLDLQVSVLCNNAGFGTYDDFAELDREREIAEVRTNVEAVVDLTGRWLPKMVERGAGAVLNTASTAAFQPIPGNATYAASKAFVLSFSEALHTEVAGEQSRPPGWPERRSLQARSGPAPTSPPFDPRGAPSTGARAERKRARTYNGSRHISHIGGPFGSGTSSVTRNPCRE